MDYYSQARQLFDLKWRVIGTKDSFSILKDNVPEAKPLPLNNNWGGTDIATGVTVVESGMSRADVLAMLSNSPRVTTDMEAATVPGLISNEHQHISISDIAEIISLGGTLTIVNLPDSLRIHEILEIYLDSVKTAIRESPNFRAPPTEDIESLEKLYNMLNAMATVEYNKGEYKYTVFDLARLSRASATGNQISSKDVAIRLNGNTGLVGVDGLGKTTDTGRSIYDIR